MQAWVLLVLGLATVVPALCQVAPDANGGSGDESQMMTPPPVSGQSYPTEAGSESRSNFLSAGLGFSAAYIDNLYAGTSNPVAETTLSLYPTIAIDQTTPRQHRSFMYSPGFTFYRPSSVLNEVDQSLSAMYEYRLTRHVAFNASDTFQKSSTSFGTSDAVSGSPQTTVPGIVIPFAQRLTNTANAALSYQFSALGMIGGSGTFGKQDYPDSAESAGLFDSTEYGGSAFYNRRLTATQYTGANYAGSRARMNSQQFGDTETQTQSAYLFYTFYARHNLSVSVSGGPQYYKITGTVLSSPGSWGPLVIASVGWQGPRTSFAAGYSREVTAGGGLLGAYNSSSVNASTRWRISRVWAVGAAGGYAINKPVDSLANLPESGGGHSVSGTAKADYKFNEKISASFEYDRIHQSYGGILAISSNPNSDREMVTLNWHFTRPLGR